MLYTQVEKLSFAVNRSQLKLLLVIVIVPNDNCKQHVLIANNWLQTIVSPLVVLFFQNYYPSYEFNNDV
jgi:hypothetical protein